MKRVPAALLLTFGLVAGAAGPASAKPEHDPMPNLQGRTSKYSYGLACESGVNVMITSDSSKRVATATYVRNIWPLAPGYMVLGHGKVMVLKATTSDYGVTTTGERPGPPAHKRDNCSHSYPGGEGTAELVHLGRVPTKSNDEIMAWCTQQGWFEQFGVSACPLNP